MPKTRAIFLCAILPTATLAGPFLSAGLADENTRPLRLRPGLPHRDINRRLLDLVDSAHAMARAGSGAESLRALRRLADGGTENGPPGAAEAICRERARALLRDWKLDDTALAVPDAELDAAVAEALADEEAISVEAGRLRNLIELELDVEAVRLIDAIEDGARRQRIFRELWDYDLMRMRPRSRKGLFGTLFGTKKKEPEFGWREKIELGRQVSRAWRLRSLLIDRDELSFRLLDHLSAKAFPESGFAHPMGSVVRKSPRARPDDFMLEFLGAAPPGFVNLDATAMQMIWGGHRRDPVSSLAEQALRRAEQFSTDNPVVAEALLRAVARAAEGTEHGRESSRRLDAIATPSAAVRRAPHAPPPDEDPSAALFDTTRVHSFEIELDEAAETSLRRRPKEYVRARFRSGNEVLEDVGVRLKGFLGSYRPLDDTSKAAFSVKFNAFTPGQRLHGTRRILLNNASQDPSRLNEFIYYGVCRDAGIPAPRVTWANVRVNGEPFGIYVVVEASTRQFLKRWFSDTSGDLYEGPGDVFSWEKLELDTNQETSERKSLRRLAETIEKARDDDPLESIGKALDVDAFARFLAVELIAGHWDGYAGMANNYRIYHDPARDRFVFVPHGADQPFERVDARLDRPLKGILARALTRTEPGRAVLRDALLAVFRDAWREDKIRARMAGAYQLIREHVRADPRSIYTPLRFEEGVQELLEFIRHRRIFVLDELGEIPGTSWRDLHPGSFEIFALPFLMEEPR